MYTTAPAPPPSAKPHPMATTISRDSADPPPPLPPSPAIHSHDIQALSPFYDVICFLTSFTAPYFCIFYAYTGYQPDTYAVMLPVQAACCCLQLFMRPRNESPGYMFLLSTSFFCLTVLSEVMLCVGNTKADRRDGSNIFMDYLPIHIVRR